MADRRVGMSCMVAVAAALAASAAAQTAPAGSPPPETIRLSFPENMEVKVLAEYVSQRLNVNILYDEQVGAKKLTVRAPVEIPKESLLGLLQSALAMKGLVLAEGDQPGWKKIVPAQNLLTVTRQVHPQAPGELESAEAVTVVVKLSHVSAKVMEATLKPFLTQPGANTLEIPEQGMLIVTDYAGNFPRLMELVRLTDRAGQAGVCRFVAARHVGATALAGDLTRLLAEKNKAGASAPAGPAAVLALERTGQLALLGTEGQVEAAMALLKDLDAPSETLTKVYQFQAVSPERIEKLAKELSDPETLRTRYRSSIDKDWSLLVVTAPADVHARIASLKEQLDLAAAAEAAPVRFYKVYNGTAAEVLATIQNLKGACQVLPVALAVPASSPSVPPGPNRPPRQLEQPWPTPPAYTGPGVDGRPTEILTESLRPAPTVRTEDATVTADEKTNSIIVVAPPAVQKVYEDLIRKLDKRRPQVLVEVTMVTVDVSKSLSLGVDAAYRGSINGDPMLLLSSFGLGTVNAATGNLALRPGLGFSALLSPDRADVVIRALATCGQARVVSAPKILVNDNATGTLASIAEAPFTSVNASDTVATTSFAGYASAGTTIAVTPRIAEGDHLQLLYNITLNSFTGQGSAGVPPPRQTNSVGSEVTVPDGYAVVVGGLKRSDESRTESKIPLLGDIPLLGLAFGNRTRTESDNRLYVFIRPIILRDDDFADLKYLSEADLARAGCAANYPVSSYMLMD